MRASLSPYYTRRGRTRGGGGGGGGLYRSVTAPARTPSPGPNNRRNDGNNVRGRSATPPATARATPRQLWQRATRTVLNRQAVNEVDAAFDAMERKQYIDGLVAKSILNFFNSKGSYMLVSAAFGLVGHPASIVPGGMSALAHVSRVSWAGIAGNFCGPAIPETVTAVLDRARKLALVKPVVATASAVRKAADFLGSMLVKSCSVPVSAATSGPGKTAVSVLRRSPSRITVPTAGRWVQIAQMVLTLGMLKAGEADDVKATQTFIVLPLVLGPHLDAVFASWNKAILQDKLKLPSGSHVLNLLADAPPAVKQASKKLLSPVGLPKGSRYTQKVVQYLLTKVDKKQRSAILAVVAHFSSGWLRATINTLNLRSRSKRGINQSNTTTVRDLETALNKMPLNNNTRNAVSSSVSRSSSSVSSDRSRSPGTPNVPNVRRARR